MAKYVGGEALEGVVEADNLQVQERTVSVTAEKSKPCIRYKYFCE